MNFVANMNTSKFITSTFAIVLDRFFGTSVDLFLSDSPCSRNLDSNSKIALTRD